MFSESIAAEVSPERLERFFYRRGNHFVVKNDIRHNIVFAKHNLLEDPPFTRMNLVSCRNLLIYFRNDAQERVMRRLQYPSRPAVICSSARARASPASRRTSARSAPSIRCIASCGMERRLLSRFRR